MAEPSPRTWRTKDQAMKLMVCQLRFPLAAALTLSAAWLLAPASARAECGDYVMVEDQEEHMPRPGSPTPGPCSGHDCRQTPNVPLRPPTPPATSNLNDWACLLGRIDPPPATARRFALHDDPGHPIHRPTSIFHPPRASGRFLSSSQLGNASEKPCMNTLL